MGRPAIWASLAVLDFAFDEGDVGGGASHVEGDDVVETAGAGGGGGADDASGGAGEHGADGLAGGGGERGDASAGLHDEDAGGGRPAFGFRLPEQARLSYSRLSRP